MTQFRSLRFRPSQVQVIRFVLSFLLATLLWGWVTQLQDPLTTKRLSGIPVETADLPATWQIVSPLPETTVTLSDARSRINPITKADVTVRIDTSGIQGPGRYQAPLTVDSPSVNTRSVEPSEVTIQVDDRVTAVFPLTSQNTNDGDQSRSIGGVTPDVSEVTVTGPSSVVDRIESVVLPVSLGQQVDDYTDNLSPYAADEQGQRIDDVDIDPAEVPTRIEVRTRGKSVSVIANTVGTPADGFSVEQRSAVPDVVVVDGLPEVLDGLLFVNTEPVDVTNASESFSARVGLADIPEGVTVIDPTGGTIEVRIAVSDTTQTAQSLSALTVGEMGLERGLAAELDPPQVSLQVSAPVEILQTMQAEDVHVFVNLAGLGPGMYILEPQVTMPQGATWLGNDPQSVTVTIREQGAGESALDTGSPSPPRPTPLATPG